MDRLKALGLETSALTEIVINEDDADLVVGQYELDLPEDASAPVAVKVTDMLGEEAVVVVERH